MKKTSSFWILPGAFVALSSLAFVAGGCNNPETTAESSPVADSSPVLEESPVAEASPVEEGGKMAGPPPPPPGPKAPGDFDKKPFKSSGKPVTTASGLKYEDMTVGKGAVAEPGKTCFMHYTGTLTDGTKFDSSRDRGEPFDFPLGAGRVIKGWDEGVAGMKVGGRRKLTIPANLAYGANPPSAEIPPNATLLFDVELMDVR